MSKEAIDAIKQLTLQLQKIGPLPGECNVSQILISIVPILGVLMGTTLLFFFLLWRFRIHRELVRAGQYYSSFWDNLRILSLLIGSVSTSIGLPLTLLFFAVDGITYAALGGLIPLFAGLGFIIYYIFSKHNSNAD